MRWARKMNAASNRMAAAQRRKAAANRRRANQNARRTTRLPPLQNDRIIPSDLRRAVLHRDGNACLICGARTNLELHHVVPVANGGATSANNLRTLCVSCHRGQLGQHTKREVRTVPRTPTNTVPRTPIKSQFLVDDSSTFRRSPVNTVTTPSTNTAPRTPIKSQLGLWVDEAGVIRGKPLDDAGVIRGKPLDDAGVIRDKSVLKKGFWARFLGR